MPLLANVLTGLPPIEEPTPDPPPVFRPDFTPESPFVTWTPDGGEERILTCGGQARMMPGVVGLNLPPDSQFESELVVGDGSIESGRRRLPREVTFSAWIKAKSLTEFEAARRALMRDLDPARAGRFTWALPDGTSRELRCRASEVADESGHLGGQIVNRGQWRVTLRAVDPYWYGEEVTLPFSPPTGGDFYGGGSGAPPYIISESDTTGTQTIVIDGEVEVFPVWWFRGPCTTASLANLDTGQTLQITPNLTAGQALMVTTDPRTIAAKKFLRGTLVQADDGSWSLTSPVNAWLQTAGNFPVLWPLQPGQNSVDIQVAGTSEQSLVRMVYRVRYLTA